MTAVALAALVGASWLGGVARAADAGCVFLVDGEPAEQLDCAAGGAWVVRCTLPDGLDGKLRIRASAPSLGLEGEVRVPLGTAGLLQVPISGPGGRAGRFEVDREGGGLLPGQTLGPNQWCPVVQPAVTPGSARALAALAITVTAHRQTGSVDEVLAGGVTNRVPVYDAGTVVGSADTEIVQREVGSVPVLTGAEAAAAMAPTPVRGQLQVAGADGAWRSIGFSGQRSRVDVDTGEVTVLVLDFVAPEVADAVGGGVSGAETWVTKDLVAWFGGDPGALLGLAAWGRSGLKRAAEPGGAAVALAPTVRNGRKWRIGGDSRAELRVGTFGDRLRVVVAWRAAPLDAPARLAIDATAAAGLDGQ